MPAVKLVALGGAEHYALALCTVLYWITMLAQANGATRAYRRNIELRFENADLLTQLRSEKARAEDANLAKSEFLAAASHDLRQPIHAQGLFLDVLAATPLSAHQLEVKLAPQANAKHLIYRSRDTTAVVHSDPALVGLILRNLVSNAIRSTERGGMLAVEVRDTCIDTAPERLREAQAIGVPLLHKPVNTD